MNKIIIGLFLLLMVFGTAFAAGQKEEDQIRIGIMPDAGALPLLLMENVETIPFMSARERDTALQLGELDAVMTDLVSVISFAQKEFPLKILTITESRFMIVAHPDFSEGDKWSIGLSENTVIEFMVDYLSGENSKKPTLDKISIPQVPVRMEMLRNGKIPLACLTDAMAWPLLGNDFKILMDQRGRAIEPAVLVFREEYLAKNTDKVEAFKKDWNETSSAINENPEEYRSLLLDQIRLPSVENNPYPIPFFRSVTLPSPKSVDLVLEWFENKYGLQIRPSYDSLMIQ
jgi:NitT/TauT family transport system substrate-binding protein